MDNGKIILRLNWFYNLELSQVDFYNEQSQFIDDRYMRKAFNHFSQVEQQHVDNIGKIITDLGGHPYKILDFVSPLFGKAAGKVLSWSGIENLLKANILIEQKAKDDYWDFINQVNSEVSEDVLDMLHGNLIDEDLHIAWLKSKVSELQGN